MDGIHECSCPSTLVITACNPLSSSKLSYYGYYISMLYLMVASCAKYVVVLLQGTSRTMITSCALSSKDYEEYVQEEWMQACTKYVDDVQPISYHCS